MLKKSNNREDFDKSLDIKRQRLPKYLYRYRSFSNECINRLRSELRGFIYLSNVKCFNDPYDTKAIMKDGQNIYLESSRDRIRHVASNNFNKEEIKHIFSKKNWYEEMIEKGLRKENASKSEVEKVKDEFRDAIKKELSNITDKFNSALEKSIRIACFTERPDNLPMWNHYANKFEGYCLEYDTTQLKDMLYIDRLFPVNYVDKLREVAQDIIQYENEGTSINIDSIIDEYATTKLNDWNYEREWRLVMKLKMLAKSEGDISKIVNSLRYTMMFAKPSRVLLGARMNEDNLYKIQGECKKLDVRVSLMKLMRDGPKFIQYDE
jgi:hypothetical protein